MKFDLVIENGLLVDGTGAPPFVGDLAVSNGIIREIGSLKGANAQERVDAKDCWVTPGFVDIHTHYDGQVTWDENFTPSIYHGTTTLVMGNCGVGFAPLRKGTEKTLIQLMEGVEDIPGVALAEGIRWGWETFPEYLSFLESQPRSLDYLCLVPHDPLRLYVMGERASRIENATADDIRQMRGLLEEALAAGAIGFSAGRTDNHRTATGAYTPGSEAKTEELIGIVEAFKKHRHGVIQIVNDFDLLRGPEGFEPEFRILKDMAKASGRPLAMTWLQRDPGSEQVHQIERAVDEAVKEGLPLYLQTGARAVGIICGLDTTFHPFIGFPSYKEIAHLPRKERAQALRDPERKRRILSEKSEPIAGDGNPVPPLVDILLSRIEQLSIRMFPLTEDLNYEPPRNESFFARAQRRGVSALEELLDFISEGEGKNHIHYPIFNYKDGNLDQVLHMLEHPRALFSLGDAGAHVGTVCDASMSTFLLTHWVLHRSGRKIPVESAIEMLTGRNARYLGLGDRGVLKPGMRADLNVIDPKRLNVGHPEMMYDLPAGGKRFVQIAQGYVGTWVKGECVQREGRITSARPGTLVRAGHA